MNFSLKQLQAFLSIVQHGSTLAAAQNLGISQPAVSSALAALESNLGTSLFYRWKKRMILNEKGRSLLPMARRLVNNARELDQMFQSEGNQISGILRLGASRTLASYVLPEIVATFSTQQPAVTLEIISRNKTGIITQVEDFSLDIGIIAGSVAKAEIKSYPWITDSLCIFCSPSHPLAQQTTINERDLAQSKWVVREEGSGTREVLYRSLPDTIKPLNIVMVLDNLESIKRTVEKMNILGCVSYFAIKTEVEAGNFTLLHTPHLDMSREYSIIVHREKEHSLLPNYFKNHCLNTSY